ncbi:hypothetical protein KORDIASMS9_03882 [Kordia sp. SMS9]|uniref:hypothetical protein n=1 Tax=Kordia sp. SMS9 TaxID=2282170 RepID=UPI000E0DD7DA|nr:hypothetical protein [Kordia sp. SMS9]AXG71625.1 hypothetical protein KORDIASMS9_03882 [Kordia sp. SMS9]
MVLIDELLKERKSLQNRIEAIDLLLDSYGYGKDKQVSIVYEEPTVIEDENSFPLRANRSKQIMWIFNNTLKNAVKLDEVQKTFDKLNNTNDIDIKNIARKLKKSSELAIVKYNGSNRESYWGLPTWIDENDFKQEYRPNENLLPMNIEKTEVVIGE